MKLPRVYPILDTQSLSMKACLPGIAAQAWFDAGVHILQFRHKGPWTRPVFEEAEHIAADCRKRGVIFVINDRADMAKLLGAGLHVGQEDLAPAEARALIGREAPVGYSTHNAEQLDAAASEPLDYLAIGPIFATGSKAKPDPVVGLERLRQCCARSRWPLVAIGGITRETAPAVFAAGADSVAVISDLLPENCTSANLRRRMEEWQQVAQT